MSFVPHWLDGSTPLGILTLVAFTVPALLRQLLLFLGFKWSLRGTRNDEARVSLFTAFSAALTPRRHPVDGSQADRFPSEHASDREGTWPR
ncbi:hypothetical protein OG564_09540 [Streptomyces sp. NBC_01280]|uniref:hypothetical protein n=1 Tax=unclassified Streptomyces TaxID=2593676 RepID=UPI0022548500|nr:MULTISPECIES: hypothetical protein [unclassified Streptomyces]MCX5440965.1 hypothetical protein [Streptomyces sp. NBC_00063]WUB92718.1 hypothetical protein OHO83_10625 [Streptomyces sp. NBC_00569]